MLHRSFESVQQELYKIFHETIACFESPDRRRIVTCEHGEPELSRRMSRDRNPERLRSIWLAWHDAVGTPKARRLFQNMIRIMNEASNDNGEKREFISFSLYLSYLCYNMHTYYKVSIKRQHSFVP